MRLDVYSGSGRFHVTVILGMVPGTENRRRFRLPVTNFLHYSNTNGF